MFNCKFRQANFLAIEALQKILKSSVKELEILEKDKNSLFIQAEALMVRQLVKNALNPLNHLVRFDLDNEKAINLLKVAVNYLHTAYLKVYKYGSYVAKKIESLWHSAFNILPLGTAVQPELFAPNEVTTPLESKMPLLDCVVEWVSKSTQAWTSKQQRKSEKSHPEVQLCLDLESVIPINAQASDSYPSVAMQTQKLVSIEDIKNLTLRAARKLASELGLAQKVEGRDLRKADLIASLLNWRQQQICSA